MIINKHELVHAADVGNGYHGYCLHYRIPLETALGYYSWDGVKCIDREIKSVQDMPHEVLSYARFNGLTFSRERNLFIKSYSDQEYTLDEVADIANKLLSQYK